MISLHRTSIIGINSLVCSRKTLPRLLSHQPVDVPTTPFIPHTGATYSTRDLSASAQITIIYSLLQQKHHLLIIVCFHPSLVFDSNSLSTVSQTAYFPKSETLCLNNLTHTINQTTAHTSRII